MADPIAMSFNESNPEESSSKGAISHPNIMEDHGNWDDEGGESGDYDDEGLDDSPDELDTLASSAKSNGKGKDRENAKNVQLDESDDYDDEGLDDSPDELDTLVSSAKMKGKGKDRENAEKVPSTNSMSYSRGKEITA